MPTLPGSNIFLSARCARDSKYFLVVMQHVRRIFVEFGAWMSGSEIRGNDAIPSRISLPLIQATSIRVRRQLTWPLADFESSYAKRLFGAISG